MNAFKPAKGLGNYPKKNILTSLLWLSGITFAPSCLAFSLSPLPQGAVIFGVGCLPVLFTLWYYVHWAKAEPDRLQTEDYRIRVEAIARIGSSDGKEVVLNQAGSLIENPMLSDGSGS